MAYIIKIAMMYTGILFLLAAYSSENPVCTTPSCQNPSVWQLDTDIEANSIAQVINGISAFITITPVTETKDLVCIMHVATSGHTPCQADNYALSMMGVSFYSRN